MILIHFNHRLTDNLTNNNHYISAVTNEEALVEDAKHYFNRDHPSVAKVITNESVEIKFDQENQEYMSPVVMQPQMNLKISLDI